MNPAPPPPTLKRHLSAVLEITPSRKPGMDIGDLEVNVRFSIPSVGWQMTLTGSLPSRLLSDRAGSDPVGDRVVDACLEFIRSGLSELRPPSEPGCPDPQPSAPGVAELTDELESLRVKYDALFCSRMGILHD